MMECKDPKPFYTISVESALTTVTETSHPNDMVVSKAIIENGFSGAKVLPKIEPKSENNDEALSEEDEVHENSIATVKGTTNIKVENVAPDPVQPEVQPEVESEVQPVVFGDMDCVKPIFLDNNSLSLSKEVQSERVLENQSEISEIEESVPSEPVVVTAPLTNVKMDVLSSVRDAVVEEPESQVQQKEEIVVSKSINNKKNKTPPKEKKTQTPSPKMADKSNEKANLNNKSNAEQKEKRKRFQTQIYQAPLPEELALISKLSTSSQLRDDRIVVFERNEFLAVRSPDRNFFLCRSMFNINKKSKKCRVQWLAEVNESDNNGDVYKLDFWDVIDFESILTNVLMRRIKKDKFLLPLNEKERIGNILRKALDLESGINTPPSDNYDDGIDISHIVKFNVSQKRSVRFVEKTKSQVKNVKSAPKEVPLSKGKKRSHSVTVTVNEPEKKVRRSNRISQETTNASVSLDNEILKESVSKKKSTSKPKKSTIAKQSRKVEDNRNTITVTNATNAKAKKSVNTAAATSLKKKAEVADTIAVTKSTRASKRTKNDTAKAEKVKATTTTKKTEVKKKTTNAVVVDGKVTKKRPKRVK